MIAATGYGTVKDGFSNLQCTSATMLDVSLAGDPTFVGLVPLLSTFWQLEGNLSDDAPFMNEVNSLLNSTVTIEDSVTLASGTLGLLRDMMEEPANVNPS